MLRNKKQVYKTLYIASIISIGIFSMGFVKNDTEKIFKNIYIQDINIGSMSILDARNKINEKYVPQPVLLKYGEKKWTINPKDIDLHYNVENSLNKAYQYTRSNKKIENIKRQFDLVFDEPQNISLDVLYDELKLTKEIEKIYKTINEDVKEAEIKIADSGEIIKKPSKDGKEVDIVKLKEEIYEAIKSKQKKEIEVPIKIVKPQISTEDVESINTILGQYSTSFNENNSRGSNIHRAGESTSDILIMPKEMFSYNKSTGARTWSNGYKSAKVIVGGKYVNGEGGGVCQVSTTIYNAALLAALPIEEVHNHTFPSKYAPRGKDAAVSYGYTDLKFKNPYSHPLYIKNIIKNGAITSKIYGNDLDKQKVFIKTVEEYKKNNIIVTTYRIYLDEENNKIREELVAKNTYQLKH